jgi:hypothetical protein
MAISTLLSYSCSGYNYATTTTSFTGVVMLSTIGLHIVIFLYIEMTAIETNRLFTFIDSIPISYLSFVKS